MQHTSSTCAAHSKASGHVSGIHCSLEWVIVERHMLLSAVDATCGSQNGLTGAQALHNIIIKVEKTIFIKIAVMLE